MSEREKERTEEVPSDIGLDDSTDVDGGFDDTTKGDVGLDDSADVGLDEFGDSGLDETAGQGAGGDSSGGILRSLYGRTIGRVLSTRSLGIAVGLTLVFSFVFSIIPFLGLLGQLVGIGAAGFLYGLLASDGRYTELLVAGALVGGVSALLGNLLVVTFGSLGLLGIGLLGGALAAVGGHYFGRDFRDGLTRDVG